MGGICENLRELPRWVVLSEVLQPHHTILTGLNNVGVEGVGSLWFLKAGGDHLDLGLGSDVEGGVGRFFEGLFSVRLSALMTSNRLVLYV